MKKLFAFIAFIAFLAGTLMSLSAAAEVTARLERETITFDETVRLVIESSNSNNAQPDLSELQQQFNLINTASSQNISIVNGQQTAITRWIVELEPRSVGSFTITPISLGNESSRMLRLTVLPVSPVDAGQMRDIFIEVEADSAEVYVQQQIIFSVRLFVGTNLIDGSLSDPTPADTVITRLGDDIQYTTQRGAKSFRVIERNYALFPQKSGSLEIPPIRFQGLIRDPAQSNDKYFNRLFNNGKRSRAKSKSLVLEIVPPATRFTEKYWLPAKRLQIDDLSRGQDEFRVGQPITRKLQIQALGVTAEQLPEINFTATSQFKIYPDKSVLETQQEKKNVIGLLQQSVAVVPTEPGEIILPELSVHWWNTKTDQPETAILPAKTITILAAADNVGQKPEPGLPIEAANVADPEAESKRVTSRVNPNPENLWQWTSLGLLMAWLGTLILLWRSRITTDARAKKIVRSTAKPAGSKQLLQQLRLSCQQNDARAARIALLAWSRVLWQQNPPDTVSDLVERINNPKLQQALRELDQYLYANSNDSWSGATLWEIIAQQYPAPADTPVIGPDPLPPLYPQPG